jgi:hypothetical protein
MVEKWNTLWLNIGTLTHSKSMCVYVFIYAYKYPPAMGATKIQASSSLRWNGAW